MAQSFRTRLNHLKGVQAGILKDIQTYQEEIKTSEEALIQFEQAKAIIWEVGLKTQQQLQYHIGDITSIALESVFPNPYKLEVDFVQRRNKTECDLYFTRNGGRMEPKTASGGGAVDVAAFALRIASWSLERPHSRNVIILDEPMRFLSEDLQEQASTMIKEISRRLGIQFIIVTHEQNLTSCADAVFTVKKRAGKSYVIKNKQEIIL